MWDRRLKQIVKKCEFCQEQIQESKWSEHLHNVHLLSDLVDAKDFFY